MISGTSVTVPAHADNYKTERALSIWLLNMLNLIKDYLHSLHPPPPRSPAHHPTMEGYPT